MTEVISRETIAQQADRAAAAWVAACRGLPESKWPAKPENRYHALEQPEHHKDWHAAFSRYCLLHSSVEGAEGGA